MISDSTPMCDEPLYCSVCGAEDWDCEHTPGSPGEYCEIDGVIHTPENPCPFDAREEVDHELP